MTEKLYYTGEEFANLKVKKPDWIVEDFVIKNSSSMFVGCDKSSKSMLALHLALCVATDSLFLDMFPVKKGRVLYIDEENGETDLHDRYIRMLRSMNLESADVDFMIFKNVKLDDNKWQKPIKDYVEGRKPSLIICDSVVRFMIGNEDKAQDVRKIFDFIKPLLKDTSFLILHHSPHGVKRARGSADWACQVSISFILERKGRHIFLIKQKNGRRDRWNSGVKYQIVGDENEPIRFELLGLTQEEIKPDLSDCAKAILKWGEDNKIVDMFKRNQFYDILIDGGFNDTAICNSIDELINSENLSKIENKMGYYKFKET